MEPEELKNWTFTRSRRGYDCDEVDVVLEAASVALSQARSNGSGTSAEELAVAQAEIQELRSALDAIHRQQRDQELSEGQRRDDLDRALAEAHEARDRAVSEAVEADRLRVEAEAQLAAAAERLAAADDRMAESGRGDEALRERYEATVAELNTAEARIAELEEATADLALARLRVSELESQVAALEVQSSSTSEHSSPWEAVADRVTGLLRAADEDAARIVSEAQEAATIVRDEADGYATRVRDEADAAAQTVQSDAELYARRVQMEADQASAMAIGEASATRNEAERVLDDARRHAREVIIEAEANAAVRRSSAATATRELIERSSDRYRVLAAVAQASWIDLGRRLDEVAAVVEDARSQLGTRIDLRLDPAEILDELEAPDPIVGSLPSTGATSSAEVEQEAAPSDEDGAVGQLVGP